MAYTLQAQERTKSNPRAMRREGKVPAIVYGPTTHEMIALDRKVIEKVLDQATRSSRIDIKVNGDTMGTFIREMQYHPLTDELLHLDFYHPPADEPITLDVPVHLYGDAKGRKNGGIVSQISEQVEIYGPTDRIPERIDLDISDLDIHDSIYVNEIAIPEGAELMTPAESLIVTVFAPRSRAEEEAAETTAEAAGLEEEGEEAVAGLEEEEAEEGGEDETE
ncbi:MAG: 50S ribosomal protein L25 [Candidatus Bipolaricaulia bacterium]